MKQIVQNMKSGVTDVVDVPVPIIQPGFLLVKTYASLVSAGTERMLVSFAEKNLLEKAQSRPDLVKQVINKAKREGILPTIHSALNRLDQPLPLGYSSAGKVIEIGENVTGFQPGDRVACAGGNFAVHAEYALIPMNLVAKLPAEVSFEEGAFATIASIALNGIRLSKSQVGEHSAVIGLGLLGLITAQILLSSGCNVTGMDVDLKRVALAKKLGIQAELNAKVIRNYSPLTQGRGFDNIFICADTPSNEPVEIAGHIARDRANVVAIGAVGMNIPRKLYYEKELNFTVSRSYGPGRYDPSYEEKGNDYPAGYIRWTEGRNLEAIIDLISKKNLDVSSLITHRFPIEDAREAYALITGKKKTSFLGVVITYPEKSKTQSHIIKFSSIHKTSEEEKLRTGVIGAGNYAKSVFLPNIKKNHRTDLVGIISAKGLNAQQSAKKFGFSFAGTHSDDILKDKKIDLVAILTRHRNHGNLVLDGLQAGKHIYCEKPLALKKSQIDKIAKELKKKEHPYLTVGFNRRFAPYSRKIQSFLEGRSEPLFAHYRVNAGYIPDTHWLHDPEIGGGRLIGEGCHFIDYLIFLVGQTPKTVHAIGLPNNGIYTNDNFQITMTFPDGSLGTLAYLSNGSKSLGKEYLEVFCAGKTAILDDYRKLEFYDASARKERAGFAQDKGHASAWNNFVDTILDGGNPPIPYQEIIHTAYATLACDQSLRTGRPVELREFIQAK